MVKFTASEPDKIDFTLTINMSLGEWKVIQKALMDAQNYSNPVALLKDAITKVIIDANAKFTTNINQS